MTVKELIEILSKLDPEKQVFVGTHAGWIPKHQDVYETVYVQEFNVHDDGKPTGQKAISISASGAD